MCVCVLGVMIATEENNKSVSGAQSCVRLKPQQLMNLQYCRTIRFCSLLWRMAELFFILFIRIGYNLLLTVVRHKLKRTAVTVNVAHFYVNMFEPPTFFFPSSPVGRLVALGGALYNIYRLNY